MPDRSFQDYVTSRFEDEIFQAAEKFVLANRLKPEFTTNKISYQYSSEQDLDQVGYRERSSENGDRVYCNRGGSDRPAGGAGTVG